MEHPSKCGWFANRQGPDNVPVQIAAAFRARADALENEALAKRRLADDYDAAQERGEAASAAETTR
jgi:hypothetical protein